MRGVLLVGCAGSLLLLGGCGFRLMGSDPLPGVMARPYLELKDPYTNFTRELERQLKQSGAPPYPKLEGSTATVEVTRDTVEQRTLSVSSANIPTEYELTYTVTFSVKTSARTLLPLQTIALSKDYSYDEHYELAKEHEADILKEQMARDLVSIAMHRLASLK